MHEEFQTVLREHLARYPLMEPQDCAKLAYQSTFGPAHAAGNGEMSSGSCWGVQRPSRRPGGPAAGADRERFVPRSFVGDGGLDAGCAAPGGSAASDGGGAPRDGGGPGGMPDRGGGAALPGMADWLAVYRRQGCPPVHHSPAYREAYDPHYRSCGQHTAGTSRHCWRRPGWRGAADQPSWPLTAAAAAARAAWET
ncbi:MAG: hypothetical protein ACLTYN_00690 [Dysosmobacter welbionis]